MPPPAELPEHLILARGSKFRVAYAPSLDGTIGAKEFLEGLKPEQQRKFAALFTMMIQSDHGTISNREKFKQVQGDLWEFKIFKIRVFTFRSGSCWFLVSGVPKDQNDLRPQDVDRALRIMTDQRAWLAREKIKP